MNIFNVINSSSIGEYLKNIDYKFSSIEAAFLIWYSKRLNIKEKHKFWEELIETMPDTPINERRNTLPQESLHEFLRSYSKLENNLIDTFYKNEDHVIYTYDFCCHGEHSWCKSNGYFKTVEECLAALEDDRKFNIKQIRLIKNYFGHDNKYVTLYLTAEMEVFSIHENRILSEEDSDLLYSVFEGLWFNFPLPFKKGDILQFADCPYNIFHYNDDKTLVLVDDLVPSEHLLKLHEESGDISDMTVWGIFCDDMGKFYHECTHTYLDFDLQYMPLERTQKAMLPLSSYLKGKISVDVFCNAYHIILSEMHSDDMRRFLSISDEGMKLAGLTEAPIKDE